LVIAMVAFCACTPQRATELSMPPIDPTRMSHEHHAQIPCESCHRTSGERPGKNDHQPCDNPACHRKEFLATPGLFCQVCHERVTAQPLAAPLKPYPIDNPWQSQPPKFSHKNHLDNGHMESLVGFHVACVDCHMRGDVAARPGHATCSRCHAAEVGLAKAPRMDQCKACHEAVIQPRVRGKLLRDDLQFEHTRHKTDRRGTPIRCEECHAKTAQATAYADQVAPRIETCVRCHDDADRTPETMRMRSCETCHTTKTATIASLAPRNHLPATERPLDHTLAFRRDHAEAAERDSSRCATCHTQMSGNKQQACDECHQTMRPLDHRVTWRELDHGTEAIADRTRCARCHVIEFCNACHSQRPRSHGFAGTFVSDHGPLARISVQPCLTCHQESYCIDCHRGQVMRRGPR
jgi:hypothetical protein